MQQDNNIENKLREMEAMELPELGQMDDHWQQMAGMLQPPVLPLKKGWPKWMLNGFSAAAVVLLISVAMWFVSTKNGSDFKTNEVAGKDTANIENAKITTQQTAPATFVKDTASAYGVSVVSPVASLNPSLIADEILSGEPMQWTDEDSILGTIKLNVINCLNCPAKTDISAAVSNAERQLRLHTLFTQLEKEDQHFTIDNSRDTLLQFQEGTALLIPANSFGGMNGVEITAREFYKTSDIVLNQLNTRSKMEQLETGGMFQLSASYKGNDIKCSNVIPVTLFLPDTKQDMKDMQLFLGELNSGETGVSSTINWLAKPQYFLRRRIVTEARVFNVADMPWLIKESDRKKVGYFMYDEDGLTVPKRALKRILKEKYGYTKVKLTSSIRDRFLPTFGNWVGAKSDRRYSERVGDSVWMEKEIADKYGLNISVTRKIALEEKAIDLSPALSTDSSQLKFLPQRDYPKVESPVLIAVPVEISSRYSINLTELGWINCDRFYSDSRKKVNFKVDLGDSATSYYTMLVFEKIKSMMTGVIDGNQVAFQNIPIGEPVKIISIGISKQGETVYSVTHTTTSEQELKGLQFQTTSVPDLKASLSKLDK